jgi:YggT family protein
VNPIACTLFGWLIAFVNLYCVLMFIYAVLSWIPDLRRWSYYLGVIIEPVLMPIRRIIPPVAGFDLAFIVLFFLLQLAIRPMLQQAAFNVCFP